MVGSASSLLDFVVSEMKRICQGIHGQSVVSITTTTPLALPLSSFRITVSLRRQPFQNFRFLFFFKYISVIKIDMVEGKCSQTLFSSINRMVIFFKQIFSSKLIPNRFHYGIRRHGSLDWYRDQDLNHTTKCRGLHLFWAFVPPIIIDDSHEKTRLKALPQP